MRSEACRAHLSNRLLPHRTPSDCSLRFATPDECVRGYTCFTLRDNLLTILASGQSRLGGLMGSSSSVSTGAPSVHGNAASRTRRRVSGWDIFKIAYPLVALSCLIQWRGSSPWARVDFFSGGYLLIRGLRVLRSVVRPSRKADSSEFRKERWGSTSAPGWVNWALALTLADLAVFLDYGHWHLAPQPRKALPPGLGPLALHDRSAVDVVEQAIPAHRI